MLENESSFMLAQTGAVDEPFIEELHFSTADLERAQFYSDVKEYPGYSEELAIHGEPWKFRLIDGELFRVEEERTPPNARALREDAGIFRIAGMQE